MRVAAFQFQQGLRDLGALPALVEAVEWIEVDHAVAVPSPLVVCGLWLAQASAEAKATLRQRCLSGRITVVVPRWQAGDYSGVLDAPSAVEVFPSEFRTLQWEGQTYSVPGVSVLQTTLHAGKWAVATGLGTAVLGYRPHSGASGPLCSVRQR